MEKAFKDLTPIEIEALSKGEFAAVSPFEKRSCYDCANIVGYITLWCTDYTAIKARGTRIPGCIKCPYWEPKWSKIPKKFKTSENGYTVSRLMKLIKKGKIWK